jgi:ATP-dependent DNA helicase RecG
MEMIEIMETIKRGEDSRHQFKQNITNADSLAAEMVAFSNGAGGKIFIGVNDDGSITGLSQDDIRRLNQLISNTASQNVQPAINPGTDNVMTDNGMVMVVNISSGNNKPYQDKNGVFWVKSAADKRKATSREEIQRMFQNADLIHADELPVRGLTATDLDLEYFSDFFQRKYGKPLYEDHTPLPKMLSNMKLMQEGCLTLGGALLFAKTQQYHLPLCVVKAGAFDSNSISTNNYSDSRDISGRLADVFQQTVYFILNNIRHVQGEQGVNSIGIPEIPHESIEEIVANALIHRDYFVSANVRVFIFRNRVEIISPGHLPNNLTVESIKSGISKPRNPVLTSFANYLIPYRGYGSGIIRALAKYPHIDFEDDRNGNQFKVTMKRMTM